MSTRPNGRDEPARDMARDGTSDVARDSPGDRWVPLPQAVRELGINRATVYRRIRAGTLSTRPRGNRGLEVLVRDVDCDAGDVARDAAGDVAHAGLLERAARAEGEAAGLRTTVAELRAAHAAETILLREALTKAEARADRLETALLAARRPWLAKVLDGLRRKGS